MVLSDSWHQERKIQLLFDDSVHSYRSTDETFRLNSIYNLQDQYSTEFCTLWTLFKVVNSAYILWLCKESYDITTPQSLIHFSIIAVDSVVDIVASYEPKVEMVPVKNTKIGNAWIK